MTIDPILFLKALPARAKPFAPEILAAATPLISPFLIFGLGDRETLWGTARAYKQDTGDWSPRLWSKERIKAFKNVQVITWQGNNALVMPADGLGWGRGLMQLDYAAELDWIQNNDWRDPKINIPKGVEHLKTKFDFFNSTAPVTDVTDGKVVTVSPQFSRRWQLAAGTFPDPRPLLGGVLEAASVAGYNAAKENVLRAIAAGGVDNIDLCTTPGRVNGPGDYSHDVIERSMVFRVGYDNA
jgi:hypothetical protein